jgi:hypothetical protein
VAAPCAPREVDEADVLITCAFDNSPTLSVSLNVTYGPEALKVVSSSSS